jgi:hypothetical protein
VVVLIVASIGLPMLARGLGRPQTLGARRLEIGVSAAERYEARVILLAIDGASLDFVSPAAADGRLPNFGRLLDAGATLHLATLRPTQPGPVLAAMATGKLPSRNGVRSAATFTAANGPDAEIDLLPDFCFAHGLVSVGLLTESMQNADSLRALPLWSILGQAGLASTIVRWPLTFPARPLLGSLVTDQYHRASEIALALKLGIPVVGLGTWRLRQPQGRRVPIVRAATPEAAVRRAIRAAGPPSLWTGSTSRSPIASTRAARRPCSRCACRASTP